MIDNILKMIKMLPIRINAATTHALMGVERAVSAPLILRNMLGLKVRFPLFPLTFRHHRHPPDRHHRLPLVLRFYGKERR